MTEKNPGVYDDIIHLPHHQSTKHPHMSAMDRAAQFSPFAALSGHGDAISETERLTDDAAELSEDVLEDLNRQLERIRTSLHEQPEITVAYFVPDEKKQGGRYEAKTGRVKKIDDYERRLVFTDGLSIELDRVAAIDMGGEKSSL